MQNPLGYYVTITQHEELARAVTRPQCGEARRNRRSRPRWLRGRR